MIEVGRLCVKIAGRDAGLKCVIVDILYDKFVLIDVEKRRRKCNILHLEPLKVVIKIKKKASHEDVKREFEKMGLKARETKPKPKTEKPVKKKKPKLQKEGKKKTKSEKLKKKTDSKKEKTKGSLEDKAGLTEKKEEKPINQEKKVK